MELNGRWKHRPKIQYKQFKLPLIMKSGMYGIWTQSCNWTGVGFKGKHVNEAANWDVCVSGVGIGMYFCVCVRDKD